MAQTASYPIQNLEEEAWELFEVGSNEDVLKIASQNPGNLYLTHLAYFANAELGNLSSLKKPPMGISVFSSLVESYSYYYDRNYKKAENSLDHFLASPQSPICYPFVQFGIRCYFNTGSYDKSLTLIGNFKTKTGDNSFIREEVESLYHLKNYSEVVSKFKKHSKDLDEPHSLKMVGLALLFLERHSDAQAVFNRIPDKAKLPTFDEKKKEYSYIMNRIQEFESRLSELPKKDLENVGFAYLFHGEYQKAEAVFVKITSILK